LALESRQAGCLRSQDDTAVVPVAWERAVADSVDQIVRRAARPSLEHVGADVDAVLFIDRAEMLACLAIDWCDGTAITRWWWQSLFRATDVSSAVIRAWLTSIEYAPAAFAKLAEKRMAIPFVAALPARTASKFLDDIIRRFGLSQFGSEASASRSETKTAPRSASKDLKRNQSQEDEDLSSSEMLQLRTRLAPEAFSPRLDHDARMLLAVSLMLERAPDMLRSRGFTLRLLRSLSALNALNVAVETSSDEQTKGNINSIGGRAGASPSSLPVNLRRDGRTLDDKSHEFQTEEIQQRPVCRADYRGSSAQQDEPFSARENEASASDLEIKPNVQADRPNSSFLTTPGVIEHPQPIVSEATAIDEREVTAATIELAVETRLGGLFYLINAALALDLYGDFTRPLEPGIDLSIWDFIALAGRELIGEAIEVDAIWQLLAKLAGRSENEPPGSRFDPGDEWRLPANWLNAFPESVQWSYQTHRGRLIVWHPAGFEALDVKLGSRVSMRDITARIESEMRMYSNIAGFKRRPRVEVGSRKLESGRERWIRCIADYLRARLARSLGLEPGLDLKRMLFERLARVEVSPARLNVFFSLADLPIEIRLAGLDRDPGWVPSSGRAIAFHYD